MRNAAGGSFVEDFREKPRLGVDLKKQWDFWGQLVAGDDSDTTKPEAGPSGEMRLGDLTSQGGYGYLMMKVRLPTK